MIIDDTHKAAFLAGFSEGMRSARDGFLAALAETRQHAMRDALAWALSDERIDETARAAAERRRIP